MTHLNTVDADSVEQVNTIVHGIIMGVEMPFPLPNPDGCVGSGLTCPLEKGKNYAYVATLPVLKSYPKVRQFHYVAIFRFTRIFYFQFI